MDKYEGVSGEAMERCSDETLCHLTARGVSAAEDILATRYYNLVRRCARPLFLVGGDKEDLIQEGMLGLLRAIREFDGRKDVSFHTFAEVCIRNRLSSALRSFLGGKHAPLNQSVPFDDPFFDCDPCAAALGAAANPEALVISRDQVSDLLENTRRQLSEFEAKILGYYLDGLSCREIAQAVCRPMKSVDNAIQRIHQKAARQLHGDISRR